jgi:hypothetical protein
MYEVDGVVGDGACGFNTDLHFAFVLMNCIVFALLLRISSLEIKKYISKI